MMNTLWELIEASVHAAEKQFVDPKSGPDKQAWVKEQIMTALSLVPMSKFIKLLLPRIIDALIEAAVFCMNRDLANS